MAKNDHDQPPLMGPLNEKFLALVFGSADGTVAGVADKFDRARLEARIRFQHRSVANYRREDCCNAGSKTGELADVPGDRIEAVSNEMFAYYWKIENDCAALMNRPALLRAQKAEYIDPFFEESVS